jgi:hypothetical protein
MMTAFYLGSLPLYSPHGAGAGRALRVARCRSAPQRGFCLLRAPLGSCLLGI